MDPFANVLRMPWRERGLVASGFGLAGSIVGFFYDELTKRWPAAGDAAQNTYVELRERLPALRLPQAMKLRGGATKALLKRAVADLLPEDLLPAKLGLALDALRALALVPAVDPGGASRMSGTAGAARYQTSE